MKTEINEIYFERYDENWKEFFISHGWVVIKNNLSRSVTEDGIEQWDTGSTQGAQAEDHQL